MLVECFSFGSLAFKGFRTLGLRVLRVLGSGLGLGYNFGGLGFRVSDSEFLVWGFESAVLGPGFGVNVGSYFLVLSFEFFLV